MNNTTLTTSDGAAALDRRTVLDPAHVGDIHGALGTVRRHDGRFVGSPATRPHGKRLCAALDRGGLLADVDCHAPRLALLGLRHPDLKHPVVEARLDAVRIDAFG